MGAQHLGEGFKGEEDVFVATVLGDAEKEGRVCGLGEGAAPDPEPDGFDTVVDSDGFFFDVSERRLTEPVQGGIRNTGQCVGGGHALFHDDAIEENFGKAPVLRNVPGIKIVHGYNCGAAETTAVERSRVGEVDEVRVELLCDARKVEVIPEIAGHAGVVEKDGVDVQSGIFERDGVTQHGVLPGTGNEMESFEVRMQQQ